MQQQLRHVLRDINTRIESFVPEMIDLVVEFFDYEDYIFEHEEWMNNVAYPQFRKIFQHHEACSVDMVFFDYDLEDFKTVFGFVKKLEGKYYDELNPLVDNYSELNDKMDVFFNEVEAFDKTLVE